MFNRAVTQNYLQGPLQFDIPGTTFHKGCLATQSLISYYTNNCQKKRNSTDSDMLTKLCQATDEEGNQFEDEYIGRHMNFLMFAAHDTLSGQLSTSAYFLAKYPEWQKILREEAFSIAENPEASLSYEHIALMKRTELFIKECLRLKPVVPFGPRLSLDEFELHGYKIPAGTQVGFFRTIAQRSPKYWTNPDEFDPYRFF